MSEKKNASVRVREATRKDIPALIALNRAAYPPLGGENIVWGETHLLSHLRVFPPGQLVAEAKGMIVGAVSSLIVNLGSDALRHHTWSGITDSGYFTSHDAQGDTLYGADVYVHPDVANMDVQYGQAAVFTPSDFSFARDGIAAEADSNEETVLICDLDLDSLQAARSSGTVTPRLDRRPDPFHFVSAIKSPLPTAASVKEGPLGDQVDFSSEAVADGE